MGLRSLEVAVRTRDVPTLNSNFAAWIYVQYPSLQSVMAAIKSIYETESYDYSDDQYLVVYKTLMMIAGELLDRIETVDASLENHNHNNTYAALNHTHELFNYITYENEEEEEIVDEEEETTTITNHPVIIFNNIESIKKVYNNETKTIAFEGHTHSISDVTDLQTALDAKAASNHNHDNTYAALNHNHNNTYAALNHNHDNTYAACITHAFN